MMTNDPFWIEDIERARRTPGEAKMVAGPDLFDYACGITLAGIRWQHPGIADEKALEFLRDRLRLAERMEGVA